MGVVIIFNFFFNDTATTVISTLSLHDALLNSTWEGVGLGIKATGEGGAPGI